MLAALEDGETDEFQCLNGIRSDSDPGAELGESEEGLSIVSMPERH